MLLDLPAPHDASGLSRRHFMAATLAGGFALAVQPVSANTVIRTDSNGLVAGEVRIPTGDVPLPGYRAMPEGKGPFPLVLVVQEIFGVHEYIRDVCRRLAKAGYCAVAPELFVRQGDVSQLTTPAEILAQVVSKVPDAQVLADLDATLAWAKAHSQADAARVAITGFCWGGRITWLYAAHQPAVKAGVAWYGRLTNATSPNTPRHPLDVAAELKAPVLGLYGGADTGIPLEHVEQMRKALKEAGKPSEIVVYPDMPHAFHADYRPSYRKEAAEDGYKRLLEWLKRHGVA